MFQEGRVKTEAPEPATAPAPKPRPNRGGPPQQVRWHGRLAARFIWILVQLLALTIRWRFEDKTGYLKPGTLDRFIFAVWHNRLALCAVVYNRFVRDATRVDRNYAALISASRDGGLLARIIELFGGTAVRGSSSRRGAQALIELRSAAEAGLDLAITPDGPRGPMYTVQPGIIAIAQITGRPILPVAYRHGWKFCTRSWDRFQIPLPFTRCEVCFGAPIHVPRDASSEDRERIRNELQQALMAITRDE